MNLRPKNANKKGSSGNANKNAKKKGATELRTWVLAGTLRRLPNCAVSPFPINLAGAAARMNAISPAALLSIPARYLPYHTIVWYGMVFFGWEKGLKNHTGKTIPGNFSVPFSNNFCSFILRSFSDFRTILAPLRTLARAASQIFFLAF